ncbi:DUF6350 family protein [Cellulomonas fimi]|uniref:PE-PGRS family protein n=1 Tax=Cellulomonas fimi (strain ATCC 484 / DSM 20113 / JCM 1341 / CCUG 24087 / LMG 16345 / NBRC 15513 / NCIMB 8980 / NCTC 7547 / NRS-133) TaxID=590998 RepID=F4H2M4_CELFA|nr:DUF6350 family protein [Cellulomonas fimi]AEE45250.1 PE-PGRS family protein [Cellulomonas fimi ATCC 484]VEH28706.1 Uncharacterised protein [Cellulomonas fimi]
MSAAGPPTGRPPVLTRTGRTGAPADRRRSAFFTSALDGAPHWATGALCALQAAVLSLAALTLPAVAAFVATSADPSNDGVGWTQAVRVGGALWLLGHGTPVVVAGTPVTLVPLGLTALAVFTCYASARRSGVARWSGYAAAVGAYLLVAVVVAALHGGGAGTVLRTAVGALLVAGAGLGAGLLRRPGAPSGRELTRPAWSRVAPFARVGAAAGLLATALLLAVAALLVAVWVLAGRATVADVVRGLSLDVVGGVVLAVAELAFLPNLVVWALAWLAGPGFAVGLGSRFAPAEVTTTPLPAVPLLGALPSADAVGPTSVAAPVVLVLVGLVAGVYVHRRLRAERAWHAAATCGVLAVSAGALVALLVSAASGAAGPGRMASVGAHGWAVGGTVALGVLLGSLLVVLPGDALLRAELRRVLRVRSRD